MKARFSMFLVILFLTGIVIMGTGCLDKPPAITGTGILSLRLVLAEGQVKAKALAADIRKFKIRLRHKDDSVSKEVQVDFTGDNQWIEMPSLYPGDWQINVSALDDIGDVIFQGSGTAFIKPGATTPVTVNLIPAPGFLNINLDVSQINGLDAKTTGKLYIYVPGKDTQYYLLARDGNLIKGTVSITEGTIDIRIAVPDITTKLFVSPYYTINIRAGKTTCLTISANGAVNISTTINSTPSTPSGLSATYDSQTSAVLLTWNGVSDPDLAGYYIYRSNNEGRMIRIAGVNSDTNTYPNKVTAADFFHNEIRYAVSSFDQGGVESFWSEMAIVSK